MTGYLRLSTDICDMKKAIGDSMTAPGYAAAQKIYSQVGACCPRGVSGEGSLACSRCPGPPHSCQALCAMRHLLHAHTLPHSPPPSQPTQGLNSLKSDGTVRTLRGE
jgi:hypothetical protein